MLKIKKINMFKGQKLRDLVNERLSAAADEIFAMFERTIVEYEEKLCLYKEENQRKQALLDSVLSPRVVLLKETGVQMSSWNPDPGLNQNITPPLIKEEPEELSIKREELQQESISQHNDETKGDEDMMETHLYPEEDKDFTSDHDEDCGAAFSWSDVEKECEETELDYGDHCYQIRDKSTAEPNFHPFSNIDISPTDGDAEPGAAESERADCGIKSGRNKQCSICKKSFKSKQEVEVHGRIHTGEKPFCCPFCKKSFTQKPHLQSHMRIHTGDKPFSCPICNKAFAHKGNLRVHCRLHTGEKPYSCSICGKDFADSSTRNKHVKIHMKKRVEAQQVQGPDVEFLMKLNSGKGRRLVESADIH